MTASAKVNPRTLQARFEAFWRQRGVRCVPSFPLRHDDPSVFFVNAGVTPFKAAMLNGQELDVTAIVQRCLRARWESAGSYRFEMMTLVGPGRELASTAAGFLDFLCTALKLPPERLHCVLDRQDQDLDNLVNGVLAADHIHHRSGNDDEIWTRWEFGHGERLTGRGSTLFWQGQEASGEPPGPGWIALGNFVHLSASESDRSYFDIGFGVERLACILSPEVGPDAWSGGDPAGRLVEPLRRSWPAVETANGSPQAQAELWAAIFLLVEEGVEPAPRGAGYVLRRMLRSLFEVRPEAESKDFLALTHQLLGLLDPPPSTAISTTEGRARATLAIVAREHDRYVAALRHGHRAARRFLQRRLRKRAGAEAPKPSLAELGRQLRETFGLTKNEVDRVLNEFFAA